MTNTACAQEFEKDTFKTPSGKEIEIYAIKHGSMRIVFDGKEIEVDPVEALEPATDYSLLPKADFILNTTPAHSKFHPKGRDNGFVLSLDGFRIYIAGDTENIEEMKDLKNIDVAFLPTNQPFTMTPEQTSKAASIIKPKVLFPYHYGETQINKVEELLKGSGIEVRIRNYQ